MDKIHVAERQIDAIRVNQPLMIQIVKFVSQVGAESVIFYDAIVFKTFQRNQLLRNNDMVLVKDIKMPIFVGDDFGMIRLLVYGDFKICAGVP